ncbi:DUF5718 family protein [Vibrio superstes]|uniref:Uncharacterized protein n=1 Tax=Vibrio superstes NBRC 103154 TaxID=1219062 RepID=A0A511QY34_9VIBR|nr:DUF5718 family protein [Vibrio superstes]GEM81626.1 hypothetical protein VSU01S_38710 [Vibrio superstes NBRC 103154]
MNSRLTISGFGIAGNSAGHLDQTGEITALDISDGADKPRALFPFFLPKASDDYLSLDPYSSDTLLLPKNGDARVQMEAELAVRFEVVYGDGGRVQKLTPLAMTVINDATYRNCQAVKLAQKKNWGSASKGLASSEIGIDSFDEGSGIEHYRLCGFHYSEGTWGLNGRDTSITDYTVFYHELIQWIERQIEAQRDEGAMHDIQTLLKESEYPRCMYVAVGAVRYTELGEAHHLKPSDKTAVVLYSDKSHTLEGIRTDLENGSLFSGDDIVGLIQEVKATTG